MTPLSHMISTVESYIFEKKGVQVKIKQPLDDKNLQLLGRAFDYINQQTVRSFNFTFS